MPQHGPQGNPHNNPYPVPQSIQQGIPQDQFFQQMGMDTLRKIQEGNFFQGSNPKIKQFVANLAKTINSNALTSDGTAAATNILQQYGSPQGPQTLQNMRGQMDVYKAAQDIYGNTQQSAQFLPQIDPSQMGGRQGMDFLANYANTLGSQDPNFYQSYAAQGIQQQLANPMYQQLARQFAIDQAQNMSRDGQFANIDTSWIPQAQGGAPSLNQSLADSGFRQYVAGRDYQQQLDPTTGQYAFTPQFQLHQSGNFATGNADQAANLFGGGQGFTGGAPVQGMKAQGGPAQFIPQNPYFNQPVPEGPGGNNILEGIKRFLGRFVPPNPFQAEARLGQDVMGQIGQQITSAGVDWNALRPQLETMFPQGQLQGLLQSNPELKAQLAQQFGPQVAQAIEAWADARAGGF